jgi:hypothetical protein
LLKTRIPASSDDKSYKRLEAAFQRLIGTTFTTNIANGDYEETRIFTLLESGSGFVSNVKPDASTIVR